MHDIMLNQSDDCAPSWFSASSEAAWPSIGVGVRNAGFSLAKTEKVAQKRVISVLQIWWGFCQVNDRWCDDLISAHATFYWSVSSHSSAFGAAIIRNTKKGDFSKQAKLKGFNSNHEIRFQAEVGNNARFWCDKLKSFDSHQTLRAKSALFESFLLYETIPYLTLTWLVRIRL